MSPTCDYSSVDDIPCRGAVTLVESTDAATGDRVTVQACSAHFEEASSSPSEVVPLWDDVPASFFLTDDL